MSRPRCPLPPVPSVATRAQLIGHGLNARTIDRRVLSGDLLRLAPGVYVDARQVSDGFRRAAMGVEPWQAPPQTYDPADLRAWLQTAVLARRGRCHLNGRAARAVWDLPERLSVGEPVTMIVPPRAGALWESGQGRAGAVYTMCDLAPEMCCAVAGLPVVHPTWVLAEALCRERPHRAMMVADAGLRRGLTSLSAVRALLEAWAGRRGIVQARELIDLVDPSRESPLESASAVTMHELGLPRPRWQVELFDETGRFVARVDCAWLDLGVVGEADGRTKYVEDLGGPAARETRVWNDHVRQVKVQDLGWELLRWADEERRRDSMVLARRFHAAERRAAVRRRHGDQLRGYVRLDGRLVPASALTNPRPPAPPNLAQEAG